MREEDALKIPGAAGESGPVLHTTTTRVPRGLQPGQLVVSRNRKWNGKAHWVVPGRYLGEDQHGWQLHNQFRLPRRRRGEVQALPPSALEGRSELAACRDGHERAASGGVAFFVVFDCLVEGGRAA